MLNQHVSYCNIPTDTSRVLWTCSACGVTGFGTKLFAVLAGVTPLNTILWCHDLRTLANWSKLLSRHGGDVGTALCSEPVAHHERLNTMCHTV
jgi:hypothetical protein